MIELTSTDTASALWRSLSAHFNDRLAELRASNDAPATPEHTAMLRGRIAELKDLLRLADTREHRRI